MGMKSISDLLPSLPSKPQSKHTHEFQELCAELEPIYGKVVWRLPFIKNMTEYKIREAHKIAQGRGITTYAYLMGILKKMP